MTTFFTNVKSLSISEGIKGVRILLVDKDGKEVEFITEENKFNLVK
jgi:hypothetical protein